MKLIIKTNTGLKAFPVQYVPYSPMTGEILKWWICIWNNFSSQSVFLAFEYSTQQIYITALNSHHICEDKCLQSELWGGANGFTSAGHFSLFPFYTNIYIKPTRQTRTRANVHIRPLAPTRAHILMSSLAHCILRAGHILMNGVCGALLRGRIHRSSGMRRDRATESGWS